MAEAGAGGQGHGLFGTDGAFYAEAVTGSSFRHSSCPYEAHVRIVSESVGPDGLRAGWRVQRLHKAHALSAGLS